MRLMTSSLSRTLSLALSGLLFVTSAAAAADRLTLTNGDSLTGRLRSTTDTEVVFESDLAGTVRVKRASVKELATDGRARPLPAAGTSAPDPTSMRANWNGATNADLAMNRGNSDTATVALDSVATRLGPGDKLGVYGNYLMSTVGAGSGTTLARALRTGARYDRDIARPLYTFGFGDIEHDLLQLLDLRTVVGAGAGVHLANTARAQANIFGGISFAHDRYSEVVDTTTPATTPATTTPAATTPGNSAGANATANPNARAVGLRNRTVIIESRTPPAVVNTTLTRNVGEYVLGEDVVAQLSDTVTLTQRVAFFPAIKDTGDYRISFDFSLTGQMSEHWQWHAMVADRYLRIPPSGGAVRNDMFIASGVGVTFGGGDVGGYRGADTRGR